MASSHNINQIYSRIFKDLKTILTDSENQKKKLKDLHEESKFNEKELERLKKENDKLRKQLSELKNIPPLVQPTFNPMMYGMMGNYFNQFSTPYGMNPLISPSDSAASASSEPFPKKVKRASNVTKPKTTAKYSMAEFLEFDDPNMIDWTRISYLDDEVLDYLRSKGIHNAAQLIEAVKKEVLKFHQLTKPNSRDMTYEESYEWRDNIKFSKLYLWNEFEQKFNAHLRFGNFIMKWLEKQFPQ